MIGGSDVTHHVDTRRERRQCGAVDATSPTSTALELTELGERLSPLRLRSPEALRAMQQSLSRDGQLVAVVCSRHAGTIELVDGFKRLVGARELGWPTLRAEIHEVAGPATKLLLWQSNTRQPLTPLEEAWLVRALYRDDRLSQPQIAQLLGRHKSWVCRRLVLAEELVEGVEASVRLGLLSATAAQEVARLQRCNQEACAHVIARRGLTTRQTMLLVDRLVAAPDERAIAALLAEAEKIASPAAPTTRRPPMTPSEAIVADADVIGSRAARLHARLLERPLANGGAEAEQVVTRRLVELRRVVGALHQTLTQIAEAHEVPHVA
ncbi:MAG: ParB/RepB/Spo0J family partition protein [Pseudomonadota bacterium]